MVGQNNRSYYVKLLHKDSASLDSYKDDFRVEVCHDDGDLYATLGGCFNEGHDFTTRLAKSLNTINASSITKLEIDIELKEKIVTTLANLKKEIKTGISYTINPEYVNKLPSAVVKLEKLESPIKKRRRFF